MSWEQVVVEVVVEMNERGEVRSAHRLQGDADQRTLGSWPQGGVYQVAHGMLSEALRMEVLASLLAQASGDPTFIPWLSGASAEELSAAESKIRAAIEVIVNRSVSKLLCSTVGSGLAEFRQRVAEEE